MPAKLIWEEVASEYDWEAIRAYYEADHSIDDTVEHFGLSYRRWCMAVSMGVVGVIQRRTPAQTAANKIHFPKGHALIRKRNADSEKQSRSRRKQIAREHAVAQTLKDNGYELYPPTQVCDRIAVKDGKAYFVEFKIHGQRLRPEQQRVRDAAKDNYIVVYSD